MSALYFATKDTPNLNLHPRHFSRDNNLKNLGRRNSRFLKKVPVSNSLHTTYIFYFKIIRHSLHIFITYYLLTLHLPIFLLFLVISIVVIFGLRHQPLNRYSWFLNNINYSNDLSVWYFWPEDEDNCHLLISTLFPI